MTDNTGITLNIHNKEPGLGDNTIDNITKQKQQYMQLIICQQKVSWIMQDLVKHQPQELIMVFQ